MHGKLDNADWDSKHEKMDLLDKIKNFASSSGKTIANRIHTYPADLFLPEDNDNM